MPESSQKNERRRKRRAVATAAAEEERERLARLQDYAAGIRLAATLEAEGKNQAAVIF